jgi:2,4-dienoyl-CoA reductase-like NADH-dependent reductase (Old Yellow Enzyme family)
MQIEAMRAARPAAIHFGEGGAALSLGGNGRSRPEVAAFRAERRGCGSGLDTPEALDVAQIDQVVQDFCSATRRAEQAGFDAVELHFGHGYLVASFLSPKSNHRDDDYGGDRAGRMKLALRIASEVRGVWPASEAALLSHLGRGRVDRRLGLDDSVVLAARAQGRRRRCHRLLVGGLTEETRACPFLADWASRFRSRTAFAPKRACLTQAVG